MHEATAQVSRVIDASPGAIWEALTTPALLKQYFMGADVESDFQVGSPIRFHGELGGKTYDDKGEIRTATPQQRLQFSHYSPASGRPDVPEAYHVVTFDLEPEEDNAGTKVTLTQTNLNGEVSDDDVKARPEYEKNWAAVLDGLQRTVTHRS